MARRLSTALMTLGVALALAAPVCSHAQTQAFTFTPDLTLDYPTTTNHEMGIQFNIASTIGAPPTPVYGLGVYDNFVAHGNAAHGLNQSHQIGIFSVASQSLLVQGTVQAGTASTLVGNFRYTDQLFDGAGNPLLAPLNLTAGQYIIVAISTQDTFTYLSGGSIQSLHFAPNISYGHSEFSSSTTLTLAGLSTDGATGYFGGDFLVTPLNPASSAVPEPGAFALLGSSLTILGATWRRRYATKRAAH